MHRNELFAKCSECGGVLRPVYFTEEEIKVKNGIMIKTGRKRQAVDRLTCTNCMKNEAVDDSFDGKWY